MGSDTPASTDAQQLSSDPDPFREAGKELARTLHAARGGMTIEEHADIATDKLNDEEIVGFGLVAIRKTDEGYQAATHRAIDHEAVMEASEATNPDDYINWLHENMVEIFESEVAEK